MCFDVDTDTVADTDNLKSMVIEWQPRASLEHKMFCL